MISWRYVPRNPSVKLTRPETDSVSEALGFGFRPLSRKRPPDVSTGYPRPDSARSGSETGPGAGGVRGRLGFILYSGLIPG